MAEHIRPHICLVYGTRPEAIKLAPIYLELQNRGAHFRTTVVVTAQHRELLDQMLSVFGIQPDVDLDIMQAGQTLSGVTCRALSSLQETLHSLAPDMVLVQGDTTTVFAGALAAFYEKIAVGHVEAGLRTGNRYSPFPEEINRKLTGVLTNLHFAPTERARDALVAENVDPASVFITGNTVIDALYLIRQRIGRGDDEAAPVPEGGGERTLLVTIHRRENQGVIFTRICRALEQIAGKFEDLRIIWPLHPNPVVRKTAHELLGDVPGIELTEPLDYLAFVRLMDSADLILTDSGGVQEEAVALDVPVLVARDTTERPEGLKAGATRLVGTETEEIVRNVSELLTSPGAYAKMSQAPCPYGDGKASVRICDALEHHFALREHPPKDYIWQHVEGA
ncbi:MAG: UDP-N-acetylglucosamine 2-epimerase (non-hydrolyzing) [Armatimonadota bacterium]